MESLTASSKNPSFSQAKVLVVGDIMLDRYWSGVTSKISPEAPVPVVRIDDIEERAGGAGNVALNIASLCAKAVILSISGHDEAADKLKKILDDHGIESIFQTSKAVPTAIKLRVLSRHQQLIRLDFEQNIQQIDKSFLYQNFGEHIKQVGALILSDYGKGVLSEPQKLIEMARRYNVPVLVDPKGTDFKRYRHAFLITPNRLEFEAVVGRCASMREIEDKAHDLCQKFSIGALLVTLSEEGMLLVNKDGSTLHIAARARDVYDVTGAGDTVIATFATALAAGFDKKSAMQWANAAAGVVVGKLGAATATIAELQPSMIDVKIADKKHLQNMVKDRQHKGEKVVMTNGCFDLLHAGHVSYLQSAKQLGDILIVAVNSDESVRRLKGSDRPIQSLQQRMDVLSALESVDFVVPFATDTPQELYCDILPDVVVKGGDYQEDEVVGADCVKNNGGRVEILHFVAGQSSSSIINKILEAKK